MKVIFVSLLMLPLTVSAQNFLEDINNVNLNLSQNQVDEYLKNPGKEGLPGPFLSSLVPKSGIDPATLCEEDGESKKTHYEVILVAEGNTKVSELEILPGQRGQLHTNDLKLLMKLVPQNKNSTGLTFDAITQRASDVWTSGLIDTPSSGFDPKSPLGQELLIESIVHASAGSNLNENDLTRSIAGVINSAYTTDQEKLGALSALSLRLYRNYNNARNPGYDNSKNNPFDADLPAGDLTANEMFKAASDFNVFQGGVCNDISETVAMVGEHLFPEKDVLTVNSGSHFGVLVTDGKTHHIIDGGDELSMQNRILLDQKLPSTNLRISKVQNGALREIAVVDTEMGQVMEAAFQTGKTLLKTDADISTLMAHLKKNNFGVTIGTGHLSDSNVLVVVAKYEHAGEKWRSYIGAGASAQDFSAADLESKYQVHFRAGVERNMFRYVNSKTDVRFATGLRLSGMYAINQPKNALGGSSFTDASGAVDLYNRLDVQYGKHNPNGIQIKSSVEVEHSAGPSNWGNTTGAMSYMEWKDVGTFLKNTTLHLNQVNADVTLEKKLRPNLTGFTNAHYQGSNIGQSVSVLAGVDIKAPNGAQIIVFSGYTNTEIGGYKTQHSLLGTPSGVQVGGKYVTPGGIEFGAAARSISGKPSVNATIKVPLGKKKK